MIPSNQKFKKLKAVGRIEVQWPKNNKFPLILLDKQLLCYSELTQYGFNDINDFIQWYRLNYPVEYPY